MKKLKLLNTIGAMLSYIIYKRDRLRLVKLMKSGLKVGQNKQEDHNDIGYV